MAKKEDKPARKALETLSGVTALMWDGVNRLLRCEMFQEQNVDGPSPRRSPGAGEETLFFWSFPYV